MIWCSHCGRFTKEAVLAVFLCCNTCGKVLADMAFYTNNRRSRRRKCSKRTKKNRAAKPDKDDEENDQSNCIREGTIEIVESD